MKPFLIPKTFDLSLLKEADGKIIFDSKKILLCVQSPNASIPTNTGLGVLSEAISCKVTHGPNGYDELEMEYPINGHLYPYISQRCLIVANVERTRGNQAYRIYKIKKTIDGKVKINARHIAYDLGGIIVAPFKSENITETLASLKRRSMNLCPFNFSTTRVTAIPFENKVPRSIWDLMGSDDDCLQGVYNGEYLFNNYDVVFEAKLGEDKNVWVTYGVNMTDFEQESSCENCFTGAVGYWEKDEEVEYSSVVKAPGNFGYERLAVVDLSTYWDEKPTKSELTTTTKSYVEANNIGVPEVSWKINFVPLDTTEEYKNIASIQEVSLGDIVHVRFEKLGIDTTARVVEIEWDVLLDKYSSVSLGDVKKNVATTLASYGSSIGKSASKTELYAAEETINNSVSEFMTSGIISGDQIQGGEIKIGGTTNKKGYIQIFDSSNSYVGKINNSGFTHNSSIQNVYINSGADGYQIIAKKTGDDLAIGLLNLISSSGFLIPRLTLYKYDINAGTRKKRAFISGAGKVVLYNNDEDEVVRIDSDTKKITLYDSNNDPSIELDADTGIITCAGVNDGS